MTSPVPEAFRALRNALTLRPSPARRIVVTAAEAGTPTAETAAGLAQALAEGGNEVVTLDGADFMARLGDEGLQKAAYLVIEAGPVTVLSDTLVVAAHADAVLLVLQAGHSGREAGTKAVSLLKQVNAPLVGAVLAR